MNKQRMILKWIVEELTSDLEMEVYNEKLDIKRPIDLVEALNKMIESPRYDDKLGEVFSSANDDANATADELAGWIMDYRANVWKKFKKAA